jgi:hypothetical protein
VQGYSRKGAALCGKGDFDGAIAAYKKAHSLDTSNDSARKEVERLEAEVRSRRQTWSSGASQSANLPRNNFQTASHGSGLVVNLVMLGAQIFSLFNAILVIFLTDRFESKNAFGRSILAALFCFLGQAVLAYGLPSIGTAKKLWKAFRGNSSQAEMKSIADFAMDNNTHLIFYCSLTLSAAPSLREYTFSFCFWSLNEFRGENSLFYMTRCDSNDFLVELNSPLDTFGL